MGTSINLSSYVNPFSQESTKCNFWPKFSPLALLWTWFFSSFLSFQIVCAEYVQFIYNLYIYVQFSFVFLSESMCLQFCWKQAFSLSLCLTVFVHMKINWNLNMVFCIMVWFDNFCKIFWDIFDKSKEQNEWKLLAFSIPNIIIGI